MRDPCGDHPNDLARGASSLLVWCIPAAILIVTALTGSYQGVIWPIVLAWMGGACLVNAKRCGRRHCYLTGPFFFLLAAASLLYGLGILRLGPHGWSTLAAALLAGAVLLTCIPEWIWGRYTNSSRHPSEVRP